MANAISFHLRYWFCCILILGFLGYAPVEAGPLPRPPTGRPISSVVDLGYSKYHGTILNAGVNQYLGMRYAAPPLGDRRWRAPQDPLYHNGVQDATQVS